MEKSLKDGSIKMMLHGERLKGKWALVRMKSKSSEKEKNWLLIKEKNNLVEEEKVYKTVDNEKLPFHKIKVQMAKLEEYVPEGDQWVYELKYDGYQITAVIENGEVKLLSRNQND